jgi:hypothetical protein
MTLPKKSRISWLIGIKPLDLPTIISCGLHFIVPNKDQVNLLMIFLLKSNQFGIKYLMPTLVRITCINGNKTEIERDVETLVDYRNKSTAATRKVTLENKTETERDVG